MKKIMKRVAAGIMTGCLAVTGFAMSPEKRVQADAATEETGKYPDQILLGSFWESDENTTDTVYWSTDAVNFYELAEAYTDATPDSADSSLINVPVSYDVSTLHDPSIIYKDGYFWMISGFTTTDSALGRRFVPMIGYSDDLVHWSYPNSGSNTNVGVTVKPNGSEKYGTDWDAVAPDFFVDDDGTVWITVCLGYYANFHAGDGNSQNDIMQPYLIKADNLTVRPEADTVNNPAAPPSVTYSDAVPINLPQYSDIHEVTNRIDTSMFKEGDDYYLVVKKDGVTNEIWKTKSLSLESAQSESNWELVCDDAVTGFEGPCLTKYDGTYYMYTDKLKDYPPENPDGKAGVYVNAATTGTTGALDKYTGWLEENQRKVTAWGSDGKNKECRHGTVITVTDPEAIKKICDLKNTTRYSNVDMNTRMAATGNGWYKKESYKASYYTASLVQYWYENGIRQGLEGRGKEICDPASDSWYWLDSVNDGAIAVSKDVYQESSGGKWVRYNHLGQMVKGEDSRAVNGDENVREYWYFDLITGAMQKGLKEIKDANGNTKKVYYDDDTGKMLYGYHEINGSLYYFDEHDGTAIDGWYTDKDTGVLYWYESGERQGYKINDASYRGKEIYDPTTDAWYWLDNIQQGAVAKGKDVYQESYAGKYADREDGTGKWVRYDPWGKMLKGWQVDNGNSWYFDPVTGAMAKGEDTINGEHWYFDLATGIGTRLD